MPKDPDFEPEFSRVVHLSELGNGALSFDLEADAAERSALAARFGLQELNSFRAEVALKRVRGGRYLRLSGRITAELVQTCVVTLDPVAAAIDEKIEILYHPHDAAGGEGGEPPDEDAEPLASDSLDIGEAVAEELALAIDPYPRKPGASLPAGPSGAENREFGGKSGDTEQDGSRPFEGLAALRGNK